jgi:hypothetical protein
VLAEEGGSSPLPPSHNYENACKLMAKNMVFGPQQSRVGGGYCIICGRESRRARDRPMAARMRANINCLGLPAARTQAPPRRVVGDM